MADKLDSLIREFASGKLAVHIKASKLIGNTDNIAIYEQQHELLTVLWNVTDDKTKEIITLKYKERKQWVEVAELIGMNERTARRKYRAFKENVAYQYFLQSQ
ncbi:TPA: DUF722 domain-containing protein [Bacillus cereus]|nr:DUF722 domain-containing protein [Bacillus cereus]